MGTIDNTKQDPEKKRTPATRLQRRPTQVEEHEAVAAADFSALDMPVREAVVSFSPSETRIIKFSEVYRMQPLERINMSRTGLEPGSLNEMARAMDRSKESVAKLVGLSVTTVERKQKKRERLSPEQSERLMGAAKLIGQVQAMVEESGNPEGFNAAQWFAEWVDRPLAALGGRQPAELMDMAEGREIVSRLLAAAQSGAYA